MTRKPEPTPLDRLVTEAVAALRELRKLEGKQKLTAKAFLAEAMETAGCDVARLQALDKMIDDQQCVATRAFVNYLTKQFKEPTYPRPPRDGHKMLRIFPRGEGCPVELAELSATASEIVALAAFLCGKRYPESFGTLKSWDAYQRELKGKQKQLDDLYRQMRASWGAADVELDSDSVTPTQKELKLMLVWFKRWSTISLADPNWPAMITSASFATEPAPKPAKGTKASKPAPDPDPDEDEDEDEEPEPEDEEPEPPPPPAPDKSPRRPLKRHRPAGPDDGRRSGPPLTD